MPLYLEIIRKRVLYEIEINLDKYGQVSFE